MERDDALPPQQPASGPAPVVLRDPVCHRPVDATSGRQCLHQGHQFYFCSAHCLKKFRAAPNKYLPRAAARGAPKTATRRARSAASYSCPGHPEILRLQTGDCPECGAMLEPLLPNARDAQGLELRDLLIRLWWTLPFSLLVIVLAVFGRQLDLFAPRTQSWVELGLALPAVIGGARPIYRRGWRAFLAHRPDMWTLPCLAISLSFAYSVFATLFPGLFPASFIVQGRVAVCYDAAVAITTLTLIGQIIDFSARELTCGGVRKLLRLVPETARRVREDGTEEEIPLAQVKIGDRLRVHPGEKIPADGVVIHGEGSVDESKLTGETAAMPKQTGCKVVGGTQLASGALDLRTDHAGDGTVLARIIQTLVKANRSKAPMQRRTEHLGVYFTLFVILTAFLTFLGWGLLADEPERWLLGLISAVSVLAVACPCALGLCAPTTMKVATGRAAAAGILFRDAEAVERLREVDTLLVHKTGVLTEGRPEFSHCMPMRGQDPDEILRLAASLDQTSGHPLAEAIVRAARARGLALEPALRFVAEPGLGVRGEVGGLHLALGSSALMKHVGAHEHDLDKDAELLRQRGSGVFFLAINGRLAGLLAVADPVREGAAETLRALNAAGVHVIMTSGDAPTTARWVGQKLGLAETHGELTPAGKLKIIRRLRKSGHVVAVAGGVAHDDPAAAEADFVIALGTSDPGPKGAPLTVIRGDLRGILAARRLSEATVRSLRRSLGFALAYNILAIPVAGGLPHLWTDRPVSPVFAAASSCLASGLIVANALRLRARR